MSSSALPSLHLSSHLHRLLQISAYFPIYLCLPRRTLTVGHWVWSARRSISSHSHGFQLASLYPSLLSACLLISTPSLSSLLHYRPTQGILQLFVLLSRRRPLFFAPVPPSLSRRILFRPVTINLSQTNTVDAASAAHGAVRTKQRAPPRGKYCSNNLFVYAVFNAAHIDRAR